MQENKIFRADHPSLVRLSNDEWIDVLDALDEFIETLRDEGCKEFPDNLEKIATKIYGQLQTGYSSEMPSVDEIPTLGEDYECEHCAAHPALQCPLHGG